MTTRKKRPPPRNEPPSHGVYTIGRTGKIISSLHVGSAFEHEDGNGFEILLNTLRPMEKFEGHFTIRRYGSDLEGMPGFFDTTPPKKNR